MSNRASKAQFLEGFRRKTLEEVPGIDGDVIIQELSAADKTELSMRWAEAANATTKDDSKESDSDGNAEEPEAEGVDIGKIASEFPFVIWKGMRVPRLTLKEVNKMPGSMSDAFQFVAQEILMLSDLWVEDEPEKAGESDEDGEQAKTEEVESPKADA